MAVSQIQKAMGQTSTKKIFVSNNKLVEGFNDNSQASQSSIKLSQTQSNFIFLPSNKSRIQNQGKIKTHELDMLLRSDGGSSIENFQLHAPSKCESNLRELTTMMQNHRSLDSKESYILQKGEDDTDQ